MKDSLRSSQMPLSCLSENLMRIPYIDWVVIMGRIWVRHDMAINDWLVFVPIYTILIPTTSHESLLSWQLIPKIGWPLLTLHFTHDWRTKESFPPPITKMFFSQYLLNFYDTMVILHRTNLIKWMHICSSKNTFLERIKLKDEKIKKWPSEVCS